VAIWGQAELRKVLGTIGARVTEGEVAVSEAAERFDENGGLNEPNLEKELHEVVVMLLADVRSARGGTPSAEPAP
jgi:chromate reductase, NAD(P)H dehydrogenase (quinone)